MKNSIRNPSPPLLSGLTWRTITHEDLTALCKLADDCQRTDGGLAFLNEPDSLNKRYFPDAPGSGIGAFTAGEQLIACSTVHLARVSDSERAMIVGQVQPEWRNRGIGTYLMRWGQAQAQALFAPAGPGKRLLLIATESLTEAAIHLYQAEGFEAVFEELVMERDLSLPFPDSPLPPNMSDITWQSDLAEQFFKVYDAAFRERPGFPGYSVEQWISDYSEDEAFKPEWSLAAVTGEGQAMGFVAASARRSGGAWNRWA